MFRATPSMPVQVTGWKELPEAGELLLEVQSEVGELSVYSFKMHGRFFV